ncbi:DUF192 domain-containing protein [Salinispira pacifica]
MKSLSIYSERRRAAADLLRLIGAALLLSLVSVGCAASLPTATLQIGSQTLTVEVAHTPKQRERGLMFRKNMPLDHGMLFVFPRDEQLSFWMKNTRIPLSIAFIASDGTIKQIADMQPESLATVPSDYSVRYALEVNQGYFARHEIRAGDRVALPADIPKATQ